uniref:PiggyBac transposable element-derived protein domain-containing protein n=1 Tax=Petromyzon marinus TaxID=7757 RepID=S4RR35_PETMA
WSPTTSREMKAFFAVAIMMGIKDLPRVWCYWSGNPALRCEWVSGTMTHTRYSKVSQYLHARNNVGTPARGQRGYDPIYKVRNVVEEVRANFSRHYSPRRELSVDEGMIPFKGRLFFKQHMPAKPTKWGVKVWELCEAQTGYCLNFDIYTGRSAYGAATTAAAALGYRVVMSLTRSYWHRNHHLYFDRYFSSPALLEDLRSRCGTYACGTVSLSRRGLPPPAREVASLLRHRGDFAFFQKGGLVLSVWRDKRVVATLSTNQDPRMVRPVDEGPIKPAPVVHYNRFMGGVDRSDQYRSYYAVGRASKKWWRYIVWFLLNLSIVNGWLLYRESPHEPPM